ncbi:ABC transporter substrate-binding protein [Dactylosporangium sp. CA-233914]|uniref:ABC transporter substrate-binding protein n=1 Tax=Dactylosporangium sp. CA-233914 TaxID=3239934 RepID=UPI003D8EB391
MKLLLPAGVGLNWAAFLVARDRYWPKMGLNVEGVGTNGSSAVVQQLVAGNGMYGIAGASAVYSAAVEGAKITGIATTTHDDVARLSVPANDTSIQSPADLRGKAVGITSAGDGSLPVVAAVMKAAGVTDYEKPIVGDGGPAVANAFRTGKIQAFAHGVSDVAGMEITAGFPLRSIMPKEFVGLPGNVLVVPSAALNDAARSEVAFKLASGWLHAAEWLIDNLTEGTRIACEQVPEACTDQATADLAVKLASQTTEPLDDQLGYIDPGKARTLLTAVVGEVTVPIDDVLTNEYLDEIAGY